MKILERASALIFRCQQRSIGCTSGIEGIQGFNILPHSALTGNHRRGLPIKDAKGAFLMHVLPFQWLEIATVDSIQVTVKRTRFPRLFPKTMRSWMLVSIWISVYALDFFSLVSFGWVAERFLEMDLADGSYRIHCALCCKTHWPDQ